MKCIVLVLLWVVSCDGGSRHVSRNVGMASRRMLASRSGKTRDRIRDKTRSKSGDPVMVEMRDVDWRVCWIGILFGLCFMYVIR